MKILIAVTNSFCANLIRGQASYLKKNGHEVIIVSSDGIEMQRLIEREKAIYYKVDFKKEISVVSDLQALYQVIKIIRAEKPDIINAGNPKPGFIFSLAKLLFLRIPLIFTLRGVRSDTLTGLKKQIILFTEWFTCFMADRIIVISPSLRDHAQTLKILKKNKSIVLGRGSSNGVDLDFFKSTEKTSSDSLTIRDTLLIKDEFIFLFIGRLTRDKGLIELINVFSSNFSDSGSKLLLVGPHEKQDPLPDYVHEKIKNNDHIIEIGKVEDTRPYYELADVLILNSYREGFGNVVIEAACFEVPSIVSNIPGLKDTIVDNQTGFYVNVKSEDDLLSKMHIYRNNPDKKVSHGKNARNRVVSEFFSELIWSGQLKLYKSLQRTHL